jgi:chemotaxis signal transduction protein
MSAADVKTFVLFPIGKKRFALPSELVEELAQPDRLQTFPHTTPLLTGVLVRRGHIVPVCDVAQVLIGPNAPQRKFYLIAFRSSGAAPEWIAVPVTGECELAKAQAEPPPSEAPGYVTGVLHFGEEKVEIVDLEKLMSERPGQALSPARRAAEVSA